LNDPEPVGIIVTCKKAGCQNSVAKQGRICDPCYLKLPGDTKPCPKCSSTIHTRQRECARHMLEAKGGVTRRPRDVIPTSLRLQVYERDAYTCRLCGAVGTGEMHSEKIEGFEIDHIIPNAAGGGIELDNLQVLCRPCNNSKRHYRL